MPTTKNGQRELRTVLDDEGEVYETLLVWAKKRRLTPGKAIGCILADWSDAMNGNPNPFAAAIAAVGGSIVTGPNQIPQAAAVEEPESPEAKAQKAALLEAAGQFF